MLRLRGKEEESWGVGDTCIGLPCSPAGALVRTGVGDGSGKGQEATST